MWIKLDHGVRLSPSEFLLLRLRDSPSQFTVYQVFYMTELTIKTNNQPRRLRYASEFTSTERVQLRKQFDWMDDEEFDTNCSFFKYKDCYYNLADFMRLDLGDNSLFKDWHGYSSDSYFSGVLVKLYPEDIDYVIVGRYCS